MSRFDEDFQAKPVDAPPHYHWGAVGPVQAAPVTVDGEVKGYLFVALDREQNSAGLVAAMGRGFPASAQRSWSRALEAFAARGISAAQAFEALLGTTAPDGGSVAGTAVRQFADKERIADELNPERVQAKASRDEADGRRTPSRAEIDDALRSGAPLTERIREQVGRLDEALDARPTPDPLVVTLTPALAAVPDEPAPGDRVFEPAFLSSLLTGSDDPTPGPLVVKLRVPAGTPALFIPATLPGEPGTLLLGRGIEWEVDRVLSLGDQRIITAHVVAQRPAALERRG